MAWWWIPISIIGGAVFGYIVASVLYASADVKHGKWSDE